MKKCADARNKNEVLFDCQNVHSSLSVLGQYRKMLVKAKFTLERVTKAQRRERRYSSTLSLTSALGVGGCSTPRPCRLTPGLPLYRRMGRPHGRSGTLRKILPPSGFNPKTAQPVASRYIDWAIQAHTEEYFRPQMIFFPVSTHIECKVY